MKSLIVKVMPLLMLMLAACGPTKEEKQLDGRWYGDNQMTIGNLGCTQLIDMKYDCDDHSSKITVEYVSPTGIVIAKMKLAGEWKISDGKINIDITDKKVNINEDNLNSAVAAAKASLSVDQLKESISDNSTDFASMKIEDLDSDELEVEIGNETVKMESGERPADKRPAVTAAASTQPAAAASKERPRPASGQVALSGKIGKYPIEMEVDLGSSSVNGRYRYTRTGSGGWLVLTGSKSGSYVTLYEFNDKGQQTGEFSGTFDGYTYSGSFVNYKGTVYSFSLNAK